MRRLSPTTHESTRDALLAAVSAQQELIILDDATAVTRASSWLLQITLAGKEVASDDAVAYAEADYLSHMRDSIIP